MNHGEFGEEIAVEIEALARTVGELHTLQRDIALRAPTVREKAAAAAFLAQFYNGIENILKRVSRYHNIPLPTGETWHVELFTRFCSPSYPGLPILFDDALASALAPYRRFRHVAFHGYAFQLDWNRMAGGVARVERVFGRVSASIAAYLATFGD